MPEEQKQYKPESTGSVMSANVVTAKLTDTLHDVIHKSTKQRWDDIQYVYVLKNGKLVGMVNLAQVQTPDTDGKTPFKELMGEPKAKVHPGSDQEKAVLEAIKNDLAAVPVVDKDDNFLGAVIAKTIIGVMHQEHMEDALLLAGIRSRGSNIIKLAGSRFSAIIRARAPWLMTGALIGLGLGFIASLFERTLQESVALAFFIPVVAYIADSVGNQTSTITVRALAIIKLNNWIYIFRSLFIGTALGIILGAMGGVGALLISQEPAIGLVVGLSLLSASAVASILGSVTPIVFKAIGKDPALGSGPLATALQDAISIVIYFGFAVMILS